MIATDSHIAMKIRLEREAVKMSRSELAARIGVTRQQIARYEGAENSVPTARLVDIARALSVPVGMFFPRDARRWRIDDALYSRCQAWLSRPDVYDQPSLELLSKEYVSMCKKALA